MAGKFDWKSHLDKATYRKVREHCPILKGSRPPTMYSPDGTLLFLSSINRETPTDVPKELKKMLVKIVDAHRKAVAAGDAWQTLAADIDGNEVCLCLFTCDGDPDRYADSGRVLSGKVTIV